MTDQSVFDDAHGMTVDTPGESDADHRLVLKWRRQGDRFEGLVTHEVDGRTITEWLPALDLGPPLI